MCNGWCIIVTLFIVDIKLQIYTSCVLHTVVYILRGFIWYPLYRALINMRLKQKNHINQKNHHIKKNQTVDFIHPDGAFLAGGNQTHLELFAVVRFTAPVVLDHHQGSFFHIFVGGEPPFAACALTPAPDQRTFFHWPRVDNPTIKLITVWTFHFYGFNLARAWAAASESGNLWITDW